jgi:glyoxylase-like metal-dependent hydrolase (beta-lactamase superfamily II)
MEVLGNTVLEIDGEKFKIFHPERAHTDTDIVITHVNSKTMFMGDNVMKGRLGGFDGSSNIQGNIKLLEDIEKQPEQITYVPGHGPSGKMNETLDPFINYMKIIVEEAKRAYDEDMDSYEVKEDAAKRLKAYHKWDDFEGKMGKHLMKAYEEWEAADM